MNGIDFMNDKIQHRVNQLTDIFSKIKQLDHDNLAHLYESVSLHNEALFIVGDLVSEAAQVRDEAYANRKRIHADVILAESGTVAVKEAIAEKTINPYRQVEAESNAMYQRYRLQCQALDHRLIDYRQKRNKLEHELQTINDKN